MISFENIYENNLKNISVNIPINKITIITGRSGSGKSSLIYNVIAKESQRKEKIESGKANFFDFAIRPKFDKVSNLPYSVTLKQRGLNQSISSTLATITGLHELIRDEFVKLGIIITPENNIIRKPTSNDISYFIKKYYSEKDYECFAIVCYRKRTDANAELNLLKKNGILSALFISSFDNKEKLKKISSLKKLNPKYKHTILVPILDIEKIFSYEHIAIDSFLIRMKDNTFNFKIDYPDISTGKIYQCPSTHLLSFNSFHLYGGKCLECEGTGKILELDINNLIIRDKKLNDYFLKLDDNGKGCYKYIGLCKDSLVRIFNKQKIDVEKTFFDLNRNEQIFITSIIKTQLIKHQNKLTISKYLINSECPHCNGTRLNYKANSIKLFGRSISELLSFTVDELFVFFKENNLNNKKIFNILESLINATLGYLCLNRTTDTLSGGELQRVKIAIELNDYFRNLLYILDEPSNGLHPYNNFQIIQLIKNLRDKGNTILLSEHNNLYLKNSDYQIELGYEGGINGGNIIYQGKIQDKILELDNYREKLNSSIDYSIEINGLSVNNIIEQNFIIPLNCLVAITGVSGSGKSSLIHNALIPLAKQYLIDKSINFNLVKDIKNFDLLSGVIELTQSQIGINTRSIVATYLDIFDVIRDLFASTNLSKEFNFDKSYFSFNSKNGACNVCNGLGEIEGNVCSSCLGQRYKPEILNIMLDEVNIYELLSLPIEQIKNIFKDGKLGHSFDILSKLGLSHLSLGRITPSLSGGEAQRLKLAKVLIDNILKIKKGGFLFVLDEPSSGLNEKDIINLYKIFDEILSYNNSILVVEHNQNIIKNSDYIIDIGLDSGKNGGKCIFSGTFDELLLDKSSITAKALRGEFKEINQLDLQSNIILTDKTYDFDIQSYNFNRFYLDDKHFKIEKDFANNYTVICDNENNRYFKTRNDLLLFTDSIDIKSYSFNPYTNELYKYKKVPVSIKKEKLKHLKSLGFKINNNDYLSDEWTFRIKTRSLNEAYNLGNGWVTINTANETFELFTRFVSIEHKIIGTARINSKTFNLYSNGCEYCSNTGEIESYDLNLIVKDISKSILDSNFITFDIKNNFKNIIKKFKEENLFDFSEKFDKLSEENKNIFLHGFKEYEFLKKNGRSNANGDYLRWEGLFYYIKDYLNFYSHSLKYIKCPFCKSGFKKEVDFYFYNKNRIYDYFED